MTVRNPHYIGTGKYTICYINSANGKTAKFIGECENFTTNGICAFWDEEKEQMLLVPYHEILGLYPIK